MTEPSSPATWSEEELAQTLIGLSDGDQVSQVLGDPLRPIPTSVIRRLKDHVSQLVCADIPRAIKLAEITQAAAAACHEPVGAALAHHAHAQALHCAGRYTEARRAYEQAEMIYAQSGQVVEAARVTRAKLDVLMYLGEYDAALTSAEQARAVFQAFDQPILLAQLETNVGNIYHRLDRYHEALTFYDRARALFAAHQDRKGEAINNFNAANQYSALNEFDRACALYEEARRGFEQLSMPVGVNNVEYSLAWLYFQRGKFQESLKLFDRARARGRQLGDVVMEALCTLDVAEVYLQLNQYQEAHQSAQTAVEQFTRLGMAYETAKARMYLGLCDMHLKDLAGAEQQLQQAREGFIAEKNQVLAALTALYLGGVCAARGQQERAIELCLEARELFIEQHLPVKAAAAELQLARLKLSQNETQTADAWCRSALHRIGETEAPWLQFQCLHLLGNLMEQTGQTQQASQYYVKAIEYLEAMRSSICVDEFKSTFLRDKLRVYEDLIQLCLRAGTPEKIDEAFAYAQAAKSRSLVELLSGERNIASKTHEPSTEQLYQEWNRLREELDYYYSRVNQFDNRTRERPSWLGAQLQNEVHQREQQLARLARQLSLADAEYASLHAAPRINIDQIQRDLADDEVFVEYLVINDHVQAFVVSPASACVFHDLATASGTASVVQWLRFNWDQFRLSEQCPQAYPPSLHALSNQYLQSLYRSLVQPLESALDGKRLIIAPHGLLHYVPFHALHDGAQYLVDR
ncbi:MAG: tetratricopeptide repeat protein, partial [Acidobacteriota bacterium]|nr:tetratricopeptide repeat protein [Acidobacteriota bacterium]